MLYIGGFEVFATHRMGKELSSTLGQNKTPLGFCPARLSVQFMRQINAYSDRQAESGAVRAVMFAGQGFR